LLVKTLGCSFKSFLHVLLDLNYLNPHLCRSPQELLEDYSVKNMTFNPPVAPPSSKKKVRKRNAPSLMTCCIEPWMLDIVWAYLKKSCCCFGTSTFTAFHSVLFRMSLWLERRCWTPSCRDGSRVFGPLPMIHNWTLVQHAHTRQPSTDARTHSAAAMFECKVQAKRVNEEALDVRSCEQLCCFINHQLTGTRALSAS